MNSEQSEARLIDKAIGDWCKTWHADPSTVTREISVSPEGKLVIELVAPLKVPITSVRTRLTIDDKEEESESQ